MHYTGWDSEVHVYSPPIVNPNEPPVILLCLMYIASINIFVQEDQLSMKSSQCEDLLADKKQLEHELDEKKRYMHIYMIRKYFL